MGIHLNLIRAHLFLDCLMLVHGGGDGGIFVVFFTVCFFLSSVFKFECSGLLTLDSKYMNIGITMEMLMEQVKYDIKMLVPMYAFSACVLSTWKK